MTIQAQNLQNFYLRDANLINEALTKGNLTAEEVKEDAANGYIHPTVLSKLNDDNTTLFTNQEFSRFIEVFLNKTVTNYNEEGNKNIDDGDSDLLLSTGHAMYGQSVANLGDVNGDGYDDVAVGAYGADSNKGKVYIYFGGSNMDDFADVSISSSITQMFGFRVAAAGDVNNDGYDDLLVGAPYYSSFKGRAYIYYGGSNMNASVDVTLTGPSTTSYFGQGASGAGDVNNDGYNDVIIGAWGVNSESGKAYIYYGGSSMNSSYDVVLTGVTASRFGMHVSNAGDVNNDGYDDVIVGAYAYSSNKGRAYLYFGGSSMNNIADKTFTGSTSSYFGSSVACAGDINSDGYDDIVIGAIKYSSNRGRAYIYLGGSSMNTTIDLTLSNSYSNTYFGMNVAGIGDVNYDGFDDFMVSGTGYSSNKGIIKLYYGGSSLNSGVDQTFIGNTSNVKYGMGLSGGGDFNGDGVHDIIIGAEGYQGYARYANIYYGISAPIISTQPVNVESQCIGQVVTFNVETLTAGTITYQWQVSINNGTTFLNITDDATYSNSQTNTLSINSNISLNSNKYRCKLTNSIGETISNDANLTVLTDTESPIISSSHSNQTIDADANCEAILPDYTGDVTATDNCDDDLEITQNPTAGSTISGATNTVTLTATDDAGNTDEVTFNVEVVDNINPETPTLADLTDQCSVTATAPTTTDNCAETVTGTTTDPTEYTEQGTYVITWNFADGNGNSINVNQNIIINDNTNPETPTLADLTDQCSVTATAPTTTDNCAETVTGTTTDPTEYTEQGTYVITWNFADGNGNSINVNQNVIIDDITNPTISCIDNQTKQLSSGETIYTVSGTEFDPTATDDNCEIATIINNFNNLSTLDGAEFLIGLTTVIWTITDIANNSTECSFEVQVNAFVNIEILQQNGISIYPNPTTGIINFEFTDNNVQQITITDVTGRTIYNFTNSQFQNFLTIDLSSNANGIYFINIQTDNGKYTEKIIKQ